MNNEETKDITYGLKEILKRQTISEKDRKYIGAKLQDLERGQTTTNDVLREIEEILPRLKTTLPEKLKAEITNLHEVPQPTLSVPDEVKVKGLTGLIKQTNENIATFIQALAERVFKVKITSQESPLEVQLTHRGRRYMAEGGTAVVGGGAGTSFESADGRGQRGLVDGDGHLQVDVLSGGGGGATASTDFEGGPVTVGTTAVELTFTGTTGTLRIQSSGGNTGIVYVGKSNVTNTGANAMARLDIGDSIEFDYNDTSNAFYVVSDTAGQTVYKLALLA